MSISSHQTTRLAGLLWFLSSQTGGISLRYLRSSILVSGDATATASNLLAAEGFVRAAIVSSLVSQFFLFFLGLYLFHLYKDVNRRLAIVLLASVMMAVVIAVVNTLNYFGALLVLSQADYLTVFSAAQLDAIALTLLRLANSTGQGLIELFSVPYYVAFGLLMLQSSFVPRIFGILMIIMGVGYGINVFEKFLFPQFYPVVFTQLAIASGILGGLPTMFWFLIRGARVPVSAAK